MIAFILLNAILLNAILFDISKNSEIIILSMSTKKFLFLFSYLFLKQVNSLSKYFEGCPEFFFFFLNLYLFLLKDPGFCQLWEITILLTCSKTLLLSVIIIITNIYFACNNIMMLICYVCFFRFTLSFWAFFLKDCTAGLCMIVQHRNSTHFFSPLILLNNESKSLYCFKNWF